MQTSIVSFELLVHIIIALARNAKYAPFLKECLAAIKSGKTIAARERERLLRRILNVIDFVDRCEKIESASSRTAFFGMLRTLCDIDELSAHMVAFKAIIPRVDDISYETIKSITIYIREMLINELKPVVEEPIKMAHEQFRATLEFYCEDEKLGPFLRKYFGAMAKYGALVSQQERSDIINRIWDLCDYMEHKNNVLSAKNDLEANFHLTDMLHHFYTHIVYHNHLRDLKWMLTVQLTPTARMYVISRIFAAIQQEFDNQWGNEKARYYDNAARVAEIADMAHSRTDSIRGLLIYINALVEFNNVYNKIVQAPESDRGDEFKKILKDFLHNHSHIETYGYSTDWVFKANVPVNQRMAILKYTRIVIEENIRIECGNYATHDQETIARVIERGLHTSHAKAIKSRDWIVRDSNPTRISPEELDRISLLIGWEIRSHWEASQCN